MACQRKPGTTPSRPSSANPPSARHAQDDMVVPTLRRGGGPPSCGRSCGVVPVGRDSPIGRMAVSTGCRRAGSRKKVVASACEQKWQSLMNWTDLTPAPDAPAPAPIDALLRDVAEEDELAAAPVAATALAAVQRAEVLSQRLEAQTREVEVALAGTGPADDVELGNPRGD